MEGSYKNVFGTWLGETFGKSARQKELDAMNNLLSQPADPISPLIYIIPILAVAVFAGIYFVVLKSKK